MMGERGKRVLADSLLKMYERMACEIYVGTGVDAHEGRYFFWWGGSGGSGSNGGDSRRGNVFFMKNVFCQ